MRIEFTESFMNPFRIKLHFLLLMVVFTSTLWAQKKAPKNLPAAKPEKELAKPKPEAVQDESTVKPSAPLIPAGEVVFLDTAGKIHEATENSLTVLIAARKSELIENGSKLYAETAQGPIPLRVKYAMQNIVKASVMDPRDKGKLTKGMMVYFKLESKSTVNVGEAQAKNDTEKKELETNLVANAEWIQKDEKSFEELKKTARDVDTGYVEALSKKKGLTEHDQINKKIGSYMTGLPLINSDPDKGVGYGARVYYFMNGYDEDPRFGRTPYQSRLYAQYFQTTKGYSYHELNWDAPYIAKSLFRVRGALVYEKNTSANFFGVGSRSNNTLGTDFNSGAKLYEKLSDYNDEIRKIDATNGTTNAAFNKYAYERPAAVLTLERDFFGGIVRPQLGIQVSKFNISDLNGQTVAANGGDARNNATLLTAYNNAGLVTGYNGGFNNVARAGIAIDTRDFEPDPNKGQFFELIAETSNSGIGSAYDYARYTISEKVYYSPFEKSLDFVIAGRVAYTQAVGAVPFYTMNQFGSTENTSLSALGSLRSLRGYRDSRFVAPNMALANLEFRFTLFDFTVLGQNFAPIFVPFFDIASAFDAPKDISTSNWRYAYGAGLRIAWNQATIIMIDYAMSKEDANMFINFNHIF